MAAWTMMPRTRCNNLDDCIKKKKKIFRQMPECRSEDFSVFMMKFWTPLGTGQVKPALVQSLNNLHASFVQITFNYMQESNGQKVTRQRVWNISKISRYDLTKAECEQKSFKSQEKTNVTSTEILKLKLLQ